MQFFKWAKDLNTSFTKECTQMPIKLMKRYLTLPIIKKINANQNYNVITLYTHWIATSIIKRQTIVSVGEEETGTLIHYW